MSAPVFVPFVCYNCSQSVRGDIDVCPSCGAPLHVTAFSRGEQESEDRVARGECEWCERPMSECDQSPCIEGIDNHAEGSAYP